MAWREFEDVPLTVLLGRLKDLGWKHNDELWAPGIQMDIFVREGAELTLLQEDYCPLTVMGSEEVLVEVVRECEKHDPKTRKEQA